MLCRIPRLWFLGDIKLFGYIKGWEDKFMKSIVTVVYITGCFTRTIVKVATYNCSYFSVMSYDSTYFESDVRSRVQKFPA